MKFESTDVLAKYSKTIAKLARIKDLQIQEVQNEAFLLLAELDIDVIVTSEFFEKKLLQKVTNLTKSCGLGRGSKGGCVNSNTDKERNTIEIGYAESAEDALEIKLEMLQKEVDLEAGIAACPDRTRALLSILETALTGRESMALHGSKMNVQSLSVWNRRIAAEIKLVSEETTQVCLF